LQVAGDEGLASGPSTGVRAHQDVIRPRVRCQLENIILADLGLLTVLLFRRDRRHLSAYASAEERITFDALDLPLSRRRSNVDSAPLMMPITVRNAQSFCRGQSFILFTCQKSCAKRWEPFCWASFPVCEPVRRKRVGSRRFSQEFITSRRENQMATQAVPSAEPSKRKAGSLPKDWRKPRAMAIPKEGYFKPE